MAANTTVIDISSSARSTQAPQSSHRLPTLSAADALESLTKGSKAAISSGIDSLNHALVGTVLADDGGFECGKVAEIWGPSGAGKTALAFQAASQVIAKGGAVTWLDAATPLGTTRLQALAQQQSSAESIQNKDVSSGSASECFHHFSLPTLSHLLALILHPSPSFPPFNTGLLVIDDLHTLLDLDYPRMPYGNGARTDQQKWSAGRRYSVLGTIVTALSKLAVMHNLAVIVTTGCAMRMRSDSGLGAAIGPGVGGSEWEGGIWSRTVLFRDPSGRFAGVQKCNGRNLTPLDPVGDVRTVVGFEVSDQGWLKEQVIDLTSSTPVERKRQPAKTASSPAKALRKRQYTEIADSEDEEDPYGWAETDEDALAEGGLPDEHAPADKAVLAT